ASGNEVQHHSRGRGGGYGGAAQGGQETPPSRAGRVSGSDSIGLPEGESGACMLEAGPHSPRLPVAATTKSTARRHDSIGHPRHSHQGGSSGPKTGEASGDAVGGDPRHHACAGRQAHIEMDASHIILHSPDPVAPVGVLRITAFHVAPKTQDGAAAPDDAADVALPPPVIIDANDEDAFSEDGNGTAMGAAGGATTGTGAAAGEENRGLDGVRVAVTVQRHGFTLVACNTEGHDARGESVQSTHLRTSTRSLPLSPTCCPLPCLLSPPLPPPSPTHASNHISPSPSPPSPTPSSPSPTPSSPSPSPGRTPLMPTSTLPTLLISSPEA
ncbi:unnamed protein product, partial [Closterium sp. Naga37s-1]